ncbi:hypothetical protein [Nostoc sp.]
MALFRFHKLVHHLKQLSVKTQGLYDLTDNCLLLKAIAHPKRISQ